MRFASLAVACLLAVSSREVQESKNQMSPVSAEDGHILLDWEKKVLET